MFQPYVLDFSTSISFETCFSILRKQKVSSVVKIIKTWTNAWATSCRFHDDRDLPCLFGCGEDSSDSESHYLQCPHLYALGCFLLGELPADPVQRCGLTQPNEFTFNYICCSFSGYHAAQRDTRSNSLFSNASKSNYSSLHVRRAWSVFADAFSAKARELSMNVRRFSLPQFFNYLSID